jgi:hypothetical protein
MQEPEEPLGEYLERFTAKFSHVAPPKRLEKFKKGMDIGRRKLIDAVLDLTEVPQNQWTSYTVMAKLLDDFIQQEQLTFKEGPEFILRHFHEFRRVWDRMVIEKDIEGRTTMTQDERENRTQMIQ